MRQLNLILVGVIIAGSVRRVLKGVARALKLSSGGVGRKEKERVGEVVVLVLGEVMVRSSSSLGPRSLLVSTNTA